MEAIQPFVAVRYAIRSQVMFWLALAMRFLECDLDPWLVAELDRIQLVPDDDEFSEPSNHAHVRSLQDILRIMALEKRHLEPPHTSGKMNYARTHERLAQATEAVIAVEAAIQRDFVADIENVSRPAEMEIEEFHTLLDETNMWHDVLVNDVYRVAIGTLWLWKADARKRTDGESGGPVAAELTHLWTSVLGLRSLTMSYIEELHFEYLSLSDMPGVLRRDDSMMMQPVAQKPVIEYTLDELARILAWLGSITPTLSWGEDLTVLMDLLWLRLAVFVFSGASDDLMNCRAVIKIAGSDARTGEAIFAVNQRFLIDTESIFYCFCDQIWVMRWLLRQQQVPGSSEDDVSWYDSERYRSAPANPNVQPVWNNMVRTMMTSNLSDFVKKDYEKRIWRRFLQWEQVERYKRQNLAARYTPETVIMSLRRHRFDIVNANAVEVMLGTTWDSAAARESAEVLSIATVDGYDDTPLHSVFASGTRGWCWDAEWDLKVRLDAERSRAGRRRGARATQHKVDDLLAQINSRYRHQIPVLARNTDARPVSHTTLTALEESAIFCLFQRSDTKLNSALSPVIGGEEESKNEALTLRELCTRGNRRWFPYMSDGVNVRLQRHLNHYVVFDGERTYGTALRTIDAMSIWARAIESIVIERLNRFAVTIMAIWGASQDPRVGVTTNTREQIANLIEQALFAVRLVPRELRICFDLQREPTYGFQRSAPYYQESHSSSRNMWTQDRLRHIFAKLTDENAQDSREEESDGEVSISDELPVLRL